MTRTLVAYILLLVVRKVEGAWLSSSHNDISTDREDKVRNINFLGGLKPQKCIFSPVWTLEV